MFQPKSVITAAQYGDKKALRKLLDEDNINKIPGVIKPFKRDARKRKSDAPKYEIEYWSPLLVAVRFNQVGSVRVLLDHKSIDVNIRQTGGMCYTPLHFACCYGCITIAKLLLARPEIDITIRDANGEVAEDLNKKESIRKLFREFRNRLTNEEKQVKTRKMRTVKSSFKGVFDKDAPRKVSKETFEYLYGRRVRGDEDLLMKSMVRRIPHGRKTKPSNKRNDF